LALKLRYSLGRDDEGYRIFRASFTTVQFEMGLNVASQYVFEAGIGGSHWSTILGDDLAHFCTPAYY
jgi:hypothetical protein